jgi:nucleoside-diphosphate-sugar epimerase
MKTLLIIGGTGFFGKSILDSFHRGQLDKWGINCVIAMSRNAERIRMDAGHLINSRVQLLNGDIGSVDWLPHADYVIHAAASTNAQNYLNCSEIEKQNILAAVNNYCRLAPKFHSDSKIIYISSGAVYGIQPPNLDSIPEDFVAVDLDEIADEKRDYTIAKRHAENVFIDLARDGLDVSIARCFAFVGPWLPRSQHFAIGNFMANGLENAVIAVNSRIKVYRSYMYADDLVRWLMTIVSSANQACPIYNVGSHEAVLINDLASMIGIRFGVDCDIPMQNDNVVDRYIPNTNKAMSELGLAIEFDLDRAIDQTIFQLVNCNNQA